MAQTITSNSVEISITAPAVAPIVTVNNSSQPVTVQNNLTADFVATGQPGDAVEIFFNSTATYNSSAYTNSTLEGYFDGNGNFNASALLTNNTNSPQSFYVGVYDQTAKLVGNFVQVTIEPTSASSCPCGQVLVAGVCQDMCPQNFTSPETVTWNPFWMLYDNCIGGGCSGYEGEDLSACKFGSNLCNSNAYEKTVKAQVTDSSGNPVCGVPIKMVSNGIGSLPFTTPDGQVEGEITWGTAIDATTDSNGEVTVSFTFNMAVTGVKGCSLFTPTQSTSALPLTITLELEVDKVICASQPSPLTTTTIIEVNNTLCQQNAI